MRSFRQIVSFLPREDWIVVGWVMAMKLLLFYFGATSYAVLWDKACLAETAFAPASSRSGRYCFSRCLPCYLPVVNGHSEIPNETSRSG